MNNRVYSFTYHKNTEIGGHQIAYKFCIYDENNNIIRNNISKSVQIKDSDAEVLEAIKKIKDYIELDIDK